MNPESEKIRYLIYKILGKTEPEFKINSISDKIFEAYQKLRIASIDFEIAADMETSITDKEWLHTSYSLLRQRQRQLIRFWEVALNLGIADRTNDKKLLADIMPRLEKMRQLS
jgi:hypothetical protein